MSEMMYELLVVGIVDVVACGSIVAVVYMKFRRGLMVRIFSILIPTIGIIGFMGVVTGMVGISLVSMVTLLCTSIPVAIVALIWLYRGVVKNLIHQVDHLMANVSQISATAQLSASTASEQSAAVAQISTTIGEINQMSETTAHGAKEMLTSAGNAVERSDEGIAKISDAIKVITAVGQVSDIVDTINNLAEQSNLLALNAGIEAAKAGDVGRGFSVVAAEVRSLAEKSKQAAGEIQDTIGRSDEGRLAIETVNAVIQDLSKVLNDVTDRARQISGASIQQAAGIGQISDSMTNVAEGGANTAAASRQLEQAAVSLNKVGKDLRTFVTG